MKKGLTDEQRERKTTKVLRPVAEALGIWQSHQIYQSFSNDVNKSLGLGGSQSRATCTSQAPYRRLFITWDRSYVDGATSEELRRTALHELIHGTVFDAIGGFVFSRHKKEAERELYMDHEEHAVDLVAHWLYLLGGQNLGFK